MGPLFLFTEGYTMFIRRSIMPRKDETVSCRLTTEQKEWLQKRAMKED